MYPWITESVYPNEKKKFLNFFEKDENNKNMINKGSVIR